MPYFCEVLLSHALTHEDGVEVESPLGNAADHFVFPDTSDVIQMHQILAPKRNG